MDCYPFGSSMPGLAYQHQDTAMGLPESEGGGYRFGFNNQEKETGLGDYYSFEYRVHDARLGRFLSVDPIAVEYPWNGTYSFAENRCIDGVDIEGKEWLNANSTALTQSEIKKILVFILYDPKDFSDEASKQFKTYESIYGVGNVAWVKTSTKDQFIKDWRDIGGEHVAKVVIMTHGKNQSIRLSDANNQITSTNDGKTNIKKLDALNVKDLPNPSGNISQAQLEFATCHSNDLSPGEHGCDESRTNDDCQGALDGSKMPICRAFAAKFNFGTIIGTQQGLSFYNRYNQIRNWDDHLADVLYQGWAGAPPSLGESQPDNGVWDTYYTVRVNITSGYLNFRSSPMIADNNYLGHFNRGDLTTWTGKKENGFYEIVDVTGNVGWVSGKYLEVTAK